MSARARAWEGRKPRSPLSSRDAQGKLTQHLRGAPYVLMLGAVLLVEQRHRCTYDEEVRLHTSCTVETQRIHSAENLSDRPQVLRIRQWWCAW